MALQNETALVLFQDEMGTDRPDATMLDPGASAFLCGYGPFGRYLSQLHSMNYPINTIRYLLDATASSILAAMLPHEPHGQWTFL